MTISDSGSFNPTVIIAGEHPNHTHQLLYIEDDPSNLTLVQWIMDRKDGIELLSATCGRHGIEMAREHLPDLIVLDLHLPDMSGDSVLQCLQHDATTRRIPVVVLSADDGRKRIKRLLQLGACDYLTKPLDIPHLFEVIEANLNRRV